jgi:hypothetical protein
MYGLSLKILVQMFLGLFSLARKSLNLNMGVLAWPDKTQSPSGPGNPF